MANIETFVTRLLHAEEENSNKLIDLGASEGASFLVKGAEEAGFAEEIFRVIKEKLGKTATTVLRGSALTAQETVAAPNVNVFSWEEYAGGADVKRLDRFVKDAVRLTTAKGDNPAFLSVGALKYPVQSQGDVKILTSPLLIFSVRVLRSGGATQPIALEFVDDDVFFNPSLYEKLCLTQNAGFVEAFPLPCSELKTPIDVATFDLENYLNKVEDYLSATAHGESGAIRLARDLVAVSFYNNPDISMYRDYERNRDRIAAHPVVRAMFQTEGKPIADKPRWSEPPFVLPNDGTQFKILQRALSGENLVVKGPPGTGKTQTIANLVAALLYDGKRVLFSSKKISALAEVFNKTPEAVKPFLLRLDYESEADTAKIDVKTVHRDLQNTRSYRPDGKESDITARRAEAYDRKFAAVGRLYAYKEKMFEDSVSGETFYDALMGYMKNSKIEAVSFEVGKIAYTTKRQDFLGALESVKRAAAAWNRLTENDKIPIRYNPWYSVKSDAAMKDETERAAEKLCRAAESIAAELKRLQATDAEFAAIFAEFPLDVIQRVADCPLTPEDATALLRLGGLPAIAEKLKRFAIDIRVGSEKIRNTADKHPNIFEVNLTDLKDLLKMRTASNLDIRLLKRVAAAGDIYDDKIGVLSKTANLTTLLNALRVYSTSLAEAEIAEVSASEVFAQSALSDRVRNRKLTDAYEKLKRYAGTVSESPDFFDIAGKIAYSKIKPFLRDKNKTDFRAAVQALQRVQVFNRYANQAVKFLEKVREILGGAVSSADATDLLRLLEAFYTEGKEGFLEAISAIRAEYPTIAAAARGAGIGEDVAMTLGDLTDLFRTAQLKIRLDEEFAALKAIFPKIQNSVSSVYYAKLGESIGALEILRLASMREKGAPARGKTEAAEAVVRFGMAVRKIEKQCNIAAFTEELTDFYSKNFTDSVYADAQAVRLADMADFARLIADKGNISAATSYRVTIASERRLSVAAFFRPFQCGEIETQKKYSFPDIFEHSFYALVLNAFKAALGENVINFTREYLEADVDTVKRADAELLELNARRIAFLAASRYREDDPRFDFLKVNTSYTACRKLFYDRAPEILKLKQCFLLSPPTASLLLRAEEYWNFDVAIIDEASQMPPEYVIGIAARAKQCIVVGDENQMPPIKHFVRASADGTEDGMEAVESALELLKQNGSFRVEELTGHYRSMTESLVRYSQKRYYPEMVTFPSVLPRGESLGLFDVFVADGRCTAGENAAEADAAVAAVKKHFDTHFDEATRTLAKSVGVVAFGLKQSDLILKKLAAEKDLWKKIRAAEDAAEVAEKAFFVRNIETVQGQETDCLILSVTYGKNATGALNQNFGQLNGKLGERIFNVAVTRAKYSVTLIHSIRAAEITADGIGYIRAYMEEVERFDTDKKESQFLPSQNITPFYSSVAKVLALTGIEKERIVFGYGVTENSVRVPVAVLSKDLSRADFGVYLEGEPKGDYLDDLIRYPEVLKERGWKLYPIFAFDWIRNRETEQNRFVNYVKTNTTL